MEGGGRDKEKERENASVETGKCECEGQQSGVSFCYRVSRCSGELNGREAGARKEGRKVGR